MNITVTGLRATSDQSHRWIGKVLPNDTLPNHLIDFFDLRDSLFYVLPNELLDEVDKFVYGSIDCASLDAERQIAAIAETQGCIGFRDGVAVPFHRLANRSPPVTPEQLPVAVRSERLARDFSDMLNECHQWSQAYLGWLFQNPEFLQDIARLKTSGCVSCAPLGAVVPDPKQNQSNDAPVIRRAVSEQIRLVCEKWRLDRFATLDLPQPLEPHFMANSPYNAGGKHGGIAPFIPDTFPIKGSGKTIQQLVATRSEAGNDHLECWLRIVSPESKRGQLFISYARQFRLQHYWRVLHHRYGERLRGKKGRLHIAFTYFLDESEDAISRDIPQMHHCLAHPLSTWT